MNYLLFFLFLFGSFVMANEGSLGVVKILNTQPPQYNSSGRIIPNSMNTIIQIQKVDYSLSSPDVLVLVAKRNSPYDAIAIIFKNSQDAHLALQKFKGFLIRNGAFEINVSEKDLVFDSSRFLSILEVQADRLLVQIDRSQYTTALRNAVCPITTEYGLLPWIASKTVREDCL